MTLSKRLKYLTTITVGISVNIELWKAMLVRKCIRGGNASKEAIDVAKF